MIYESLIALQKIRDESAGPQIAFLLHDLNAKVQIAAIETTGLLRNQEARAGPGRRAASAPSDAKVQARGAARARHAAGEKSRQSATSNTCTTRTTRLRAAAAEGFARLRNPADSAHARKGLEGRRQDLAAAVAGLRAW